MNTSLNGQYTCCIDHQPLVSYSLETDRGKCCFIDRDLRIDFIRVDAFVYGDVSSITTLSRRKFRRSQDPENID